MAEYISNGESALSIRSKLNSSLIVPAEFSYSGNVVNITAPENAKYIKFIATVSYSSSYTYNLNGKPVTIKSASSNIASSFWGNNDNVTGYINNNEIIIFSYLQNANEVPVKSNDEIKYKNVQENLENLYNTNSTVIRSYPIASGQTIEAGEVVNIDSSGQITKSGTPSQAIATQSGSYGDTIDVIFQGVVKLGGITQGQQITSQGVQGFGVIDGWLSVFPYWIPLGVPVGGILLWSGASDAIPSGWALCNGDNGTPDLRDRFVVGAGNTYSVGKTGGEASHTLTTAELPSHSHGSGSLSASSAGSHTHSYSYQVGKSAYDGFTGTGSRNIESMYSTSGTTGSDGSHSHSVSGSTGSTGSGAAHNNLPPYYALCYIMRVQ